MQPRTLLGVLTPSSNTRLEPLTAKIVADLPGVSAHFSRFRVVDVGLGAAGQFDREPILTAAGLLADARVDSIVWSGTSGGWRGIDDDRALCASITAATGIPATTSTLALLDAMTTLGAKTLGLVTPYPIDMHEAVATTLAGEGFEVVASAHRDVSASNWELSLLPTGDIESMVVEVGALRPDAITVFCTNLNAADAAPAWEKTLGIPILDSVTLAVWGGLRATGIDMRPLESWGRLFSETDV